MQSIRQYRSLRRYVQDKLEPGRNIVMPTVPSTSMGAGTETDPARLESQSRRDGGEDGEDAGESATFRSPPPAPQPSLHRGQEREPEGEPEEETQYEIEGGRQYETEGGTQYETGAETESDTEDGQETVGKTDTISSASDPEERYLDTPTRYVSRGGEPQQAPLASLLGVHVRESPDGDPSKKVFLVYYMGSDDETDARSWSYRRRMMATVIISALGGVVGFASAIDSAALQQAMAEFGVDEIVGSLATSMFLIGFGFGALFAGPISEFLGRNLVYVTTMVVYMLWIMATGLAQTVAQQATFRLLAGFFGSTPLVCAGGSLADMWSPREQVYTFPIFAISSFLGPALGPVVGGYTGLSPLVSWRWVSWITLAISGLILAAIVFVLPESFSPVMLKWKAQHLRRLTRDGRYMSKMEVDGEAFFRMAIRCLGRPFLLTITEPIIVLVAIYLTVIYVVFFTFLNGYTFIFSQTYGFDQGLTGLCFLGIAVGELIAGVFVPVIYRRFCADLRRARDVGMSSTAPESHLRFAMYTAPAIPLSLFWMGWTAKPNVSVWSPLAASVLFGYGIIGVFISCYQYIIAAYDIYAASSLASVTFIRYVVAGALVEAAVPWYSALGVGWTLTMLGVISALLVPVPYVFYTSGHLIRKKSRYAFA